MRQLWAALWRSDNYLDGHAEHIIYSENLVPALFRTRQQCRTFINERFGYIREREDLRQEPHGWKIPKAVKVAVVVTSPKAEKMEESRR